MLVLKLGLAVDLLQYTFAINSGNFGRILFIIGYWKREQALSTAVGLVRSVLQLILAFNWIKYSDVFLIV